jgi:environmental stress-induced protein Ves
MKQEYMHVDSTPDDEYPIRILKMYRFACDTEFSVTGLGEEISEIYDIMNQAQRERAKLLDEAIGTLEKEKRND